MTRSPKPATLSTNRSLLVLPLVLLLLLPAYGDSVSAEEESMGTSRPRLKSCGGTPPGLRKVKIKDRDMDGDIDGDDVLEALRICHEDWQGCVLKAPPRIIDNVAVQIGTDGYACSEATAPNGCYPNGLIIEGMGQQRTVFRSKVGSPAEPLLPVFHLLPDAPDGVIFRHMTIDGRKLEQPAEGQGWSRVGGTGLPHPSWPSLISTDNIAAALSGDDGMVCDTELRNSIRFGVLIEHVDNWTIKDNFIHDMGCHVDMTRCSPAIHAMPNLHEQYGTCQEPGTTTGPPCFPINPTAGTAGCDSTHVCTATGPIVGSEGMCEGFGPGSGDLCFPVGSAHFEQCVGGECCSAANTCKGAGLVGRRVSGFGVLVTSGVDNTLVQDNVFTRITKYNGIAHFGTCADSNAPLGNVFYNNEAYDDANFVNNGGCAGTEFNGNSVDGSHMLRDECPHGCNLGNGFEAGLGGDGALWINNLATNNRATGFKISSVEDNIALIENRSEYNCRGNTGLAAGRVWFSSYDVGGFFAPPREPLLQSVVFAGNTSVDDGTCRSALFVRNVDGITLEGGSHKGAVWGTYLNSGVNAVEFRDIAFSRPGLGGVGLFVFHGSQNSPSAQNTLIQANATFRNYTDEIVPAPPAEGTILCTNIGVPSGLCTEAP